MRKFFTDHFKTLHSRYFVYLSIFSMFCAVILLSLFYPTSEKIPYSLLIPPSEQAQSIGMSVFNTYPKGYAMLFVFDEPDNLSFWMKDMKFDLDIIWLDENRRIVWFEDNVRADSFPQVFSSADPAIYVLEIPAGAREKLGWNINTRLSFRGNQNK